MGKTTLQGVNSVAKHVCCSYFIDSIFGLRGALVMYRSRRTLVSTRGHHGIQGAGGETALEIIGFSLGEGTGFEVPIGPGGSGRVGRGRRGRRIGHLAGVFGSD